MSEKLAPDPVEQAGAAVHELMRILRLELGLSAASIIAGFHYEIAAQMAMLIGSAEAEALMVETGRRIRHVSGLAQTAGQRRPQ